ncbi:hypothetical protein RM572_02450 [Streptomyces sp. DSM 42041]|uniref:Secreted protein n=1 Tax=Streptomyces hazeniae TaxID=3075538 RepID=A0ABU2NKX8_9ACTN|nr:hypothetical protein [Streptomyces sp. DSM 42041]MDT0377634.1 hypothetical protein [Streptomyces sp. DSM 42041]
MTQPPAAWPPAPPTTAPAPPGHSTPARPGPTRTARPPGPAPAPGEPGAGPPRTPRALWAQTVRRVREAATTEPGRLRGIAALLAALLLLFGALTAWQVGARAAAADAVVEHSQPLSEDAASIYRSLADADTTASGGFLAGGGGVGEPRSLRERYERDIRRASELLAKAAANSEGSSQTQRRIAELNRELPRYTGLVEAARANDRQGLPLGGAYLRYANERMQEKLLPAARDLYEAENARLRADYTEARSWPWAATLAGLAALGALGWAQRRDYLRTNRMLSPGLVGAAAATLVALLWLTAGSALARSWLGNSDEHGARSLHALNEAWIGSLQARSAENMWLVARGAGGTYEQDSVRHLARVAGPTPEPDAEDRGGLVDEAYRLADDEAGRGPVADAQHGLHVWHKRHAKARAAEDGGDYERAVELVIGRESGTTGDAFDVVDTGLRKASAHEKAEFEEEAGDGRAALTGLAAGGALLALLGAGGATVGIGRRLSEYR